MTTINQIETLLSPLDASMTECDGMTRLCHTVLEREQIAHQVFCGKCQVGSQIIPLHFWIELGDDHERHAVDYRLRMWLPNAQLPVPHGIFQLVDYPHVVYQGDAIAIAPLPEPLFGILAMKASFPKAVH